jgi:DHA1 family bicyclomycin/chloramphenicol resistance-like MFS transporter
MDTPETHTRAEPRAEEVTAAKLGISFAEFVGLMALMMALTALSIDIMLPGLPEIGAAFAIADPNDRQVVVTSYLVGFAAGQLLYGPLSDRFGRKPVLLAGLGVFALGTVMAVSVSTSLLLFTARAVQGFGAASPRVVSIAIVRDLFSGRDMARVMSFVMMVFIIVPVFAPAIGQVLLALGSWSWTFHALLVVAVLATAWAGFRLPETRREQPSGPPIPLKRAIALTLASTATVGYVVAAGFMFGCLMSYIGAAQQIFVDVYDLGVYFPLAFGAVASVMAVASFTNSQLVHRHGMRRVSHTALLCFLLIAVLLVGIALAARPPLLLFCVLLAADFFMFGLIVPNFNAIAMHPLGRVAGTASSIIGFSTTMAGAAFGWLVGQLFDGTVLPLAAGFAVLALCATLAVLAVEGRERLFRGE